MRNPRGKIFILFPIVKQKWLNSFGKKKIFPLCKYLFILFTIYLRCMNNNCHNFIKCFDKISSKFFHLALLYFAIKEYNNKVIVRNDCIWKF